MENCRRYQSECYLVVSELAKSIVQVSILLLVYRVTVLELGTYSIGNLYQQSRQ